MVQNDLAFSRIAFERPVQSEWETGEAQSMCFDLGKMTVPIENRSVVLGTIRLAQSLFLAYSRFANNVRAAGPIGMGEALIDAF